MSVKIAEEAEIKREAAEEIAKMIEGFVPGQIRMAAGEMTAQEMRTVQAVQRWWVSAIRHKFADIKSGDT